MPIIISAATPSQFILAYFERAYAFRLYIISLILMRGADISA